MWTLAAGPSLPCGPAPGHSLSSSHTEAGCAGPQWGSVLCTLGRVCPQPSLPGSYLEALTNQRRGLLSVPSLVLSLVSGGSLCGTGSRKVAAWPGRVSLALTHWVDWVHVMKEFVGKTGSRGLRFSEEDGLGLSHPLTAAFLLCSICSAKAGRLCGSCTSSTLWRPSMSRTWW